MAVLVTGGAGYIGSHMVLELLDAGEKVVVLDNLSTGFDWAVPPEAKLVVGDIGDQALVARDHRASIGVDAIVHFAAKIVVPEFGRRPARLLPQQHRQVARADRDARSQGGVKHFIFSSTAAVYGEPRDVPVPEDAAARPDQPLRPLQADDRVDAAGRRRARMTCATWRCAISTSPGADPQGRSGQSTPQRHASDQGRGPGGARPAALSRGVRHRLPDPRRHLPARLHPGHATSPTRISRRSTTCARGGDSLTLNCGYGRGYSVLEVIDVVKRVSGVDFEVRLSPAPARRSGADRRQGRPHPRGAGLAAAPRRPRRHRRSGARLGAGARDVGTSAEGLVGGQRQP